MKNNKGFTLIELLAVIVILAIIALIASPIIVGLIDDARKESAANSAYGVYKSAENVYAKILMASGNGLPDVIIYTFGETGDPEIGYGDVETETIPAGWNIDPEDATLDFNGSKPTAGTLTLETNGTVTVNSTLEINGFECTQETGSEFTCN